MRGIVYLMALVLLAGCATTQSGITQKNGQRYIQVNHLTPSDIAQLTDKELVLAYGRAKAMSGVAQQKVGSQSFAANMVWMGTVTQMSDITSFIEIEMRRRGMQP